MPKHTEHLEKLTKDDSEVFRIHFVSRLAILHSPKMFDDSLEGRLMDWRKATQASTDSAETGLDVHFWIAISWIDQLIQVPTSIFGELHALRMGQRKDGLRQFAKICLVLELLGHMMGKATYTV